MDIVIVGCGGHGREVNDIVAAINATSRPDPRIGPVGPTRTLGARTGPADPRTGPADRLRVLGFVDDRPAEVNLKRVQRLGVPFLGPVDRLVELDPVPHVALGIGDPRVRRSLAYRIDAYRLPAVTLLHPAATIGPDTVLGEGVVVFAGARVTTNVTLGRHVHLNQNCTVGHDSVLDDFVSVNPLAAVSGDCRLDEAVLVGTTAAVLQGLRIGADAVVGAGACVVRDVPAGAVVKGVPAR